MRLTDDEKAILDGGKGDAVQMAMAILVELGDVFGADRLIPVSQVHIDTTLYMVDAGVDFAEYFAAHGASVAVPTSLNSSAIDLIRWKAYRTPPDLLEKSRRLENAYLRMKAVPTWTCAPYQQGILPGFGQHIAWGESNAIAFANSVIGARTNRYADLADICAAIIGKVPEFGLHLTENRSARMLIRVVDVPDIWLQKRAAYPLLGYIFGEMAGDRVAAIDGIPKRVSMDCLKSFSAAAASSGAVGLFHVIGVTPEARSHEMCFGNTAPDEILEITPLQMMKALEKLSPNTGKAPDLIAVGCPHFSYPEFDYLAICLNGRRIHDSMVFWAFTGRSVYNMIRHSGLLSDLNKSGVTVFTDGCPLQYPKSEWHFSAAMSDSAKYASYCYSQTGLNVTLGSIENCVETAVHGKRCCSEFI
jgi:hypothetical protein